MVATNTELVPLRKRLFPKLSVSLILVATIYLAAQNTFGRDQSFPASQSLPLPKTCQAQGESSEKISLLLDSVHDRPTAGAYNTLGVLYAEADRVLCAIAAFQSALSIEDQNWEAHYNLALALLRKGDRARAAKELQTAIQQKPDSVSAHFALGTLFEGDKELAMAEEQFHDTVKIDPHFAAGAVKLSQVLIAENKLNMAIASLEDALKSSPPAEETVSLQSALAIAYSENGESEKALTALKDSVTSHPASAEAHLNLGLLYARQGTSFDEAATTEFREALRLDENMEVARIALARQFVSSQRYSEAVSVLFENIHGWPRDAQVLYTLGLAYRGLKQLDKAIDALKHAVVNDPKDAAIRFELAELLGETGKIREAIHQLEVAEQINPLNLEVHEMLASLLEKAGNKQRSAAENAKIRELKMGADRETAIAKLYGEANQALAAGNAKSAAEIYRRALKLKPRDAKLHYNLALALGNLGDSLSEQKELEVSVALDPNVAAAQNKLGLLALRQGQQPEAEKYFKKVLDIDPAFAEAQSNLAVLYSQQGKDGEAAALFQKAINNDANYTQAYVNFGLLLAKQGAFPGAERLFRNAIASDANDADAYSGLGMLQAKTGRGPDATTSFRKVVMIKPASATAHLNLGIALVDQFDRPEGFKEFSEAAQLDPNLAAAHYNLGRFFFETGKYQDAARELETAIRLQPDYISALYFLALTAKQENHPERSTQLLQRVVALQPNNADAQYLLGQDLEHSGDTAAAIEHWKMAVQTDPNHSQALYNLAKSLSRLHDPEATQYQDRFDELEKTQQIADRVSELGNFALEAANAQNWPQAFAQMNEAIQLCGNCTESAHLHKNLGLFYRQTGNISEAKKELGTALQLTPNDPDTQSALAMLDRATNEQLK
jgi:tetratricopeptide (TPR) repeat protein